MAGAPDGQEPPLSPDYLAVVAGMADAALLYEGTGRLVHANPAALEALRHLGLWSEGADLADVDLVAGVVDADQPTLQDALRAALSGQPTAAMRLHFAQGDAALTTGVSLHVLRLDGRTYAQVVARDITARAAEERAVARSEQRFRAMFVHSPVGVATVRDRRFVTVNPMLCRILGRTEDELVGASADDVTHPEDLGVNDAVVAATDRGEIARALKRYLRPDGTTVYGEVVAVRLVVDDESQTLVHLRDITAEHQASERLQHMARHDVLTGLGNRGLVEDRLAHALSGRGGARTGTAVLFIDLDGFKRINDALGHGVGDRVLKECARRISQAVRPADTVGRWGGDEFVVVLEELAEVQPALDAVERIRTAIAAPVPHRNDELFVTASLGVAFAPAGERTTASELLGGADAAMYRVKATGRNGHSVFDQALRDAALRRGHVEKVLRSAVDQDRIVLHYQPLLDLHSRRASGVEALLRLRDDDGQLMYPDVFLDIAEDIGAMPALEHVVLERACTQTAAWLSQGLDLSVSINVCSAQMSRIEDFEAEVSRALTASGLPADRLVCEVTEHSLIDTSGRTLRGMERLHARGVEWAVDDFGTGYSSMTYLQAMPLSEVKIDRRFVIKAGEDRRAAAIVRAVAGMAAELEMRCVAEGIEDEQTHELLRDLGASTGQGYLYARPMPAEAIGALLGSA